MRFFTAVPFYWMIPGTERVPTQRCRLRSCTAMGHRYQDELPEGGVQPRTEGLEALQARSAPCPRIPRAITMTMPTPISTSPMLNTFARGNHAGRA